jgi:hypothetical protein
MVRSDTGEFTRRPYGTSVACVDRTYEGFIEGEMARVALESNFPK